MISRKQKDAIDYVISLNPTVVVLSRTQYVEAEGARARQDVVLPAQTWLVYPKSAKAGELTDEGGMADSFSWGALAPSTANVQWGANVKDTFTLAGVGMLEVTGGRLIMVGSDVNGYQLVLKLVK